MNVLVTGGAGYIGSHMVRVLLRAGHRVSVVDDLSSGSRAAVPPEAIFLQADVRERAKVTALLRDESVDAVCHFAARIQVGESVTDPRRYYATNVVGALELLESVLDAGVNGLFVFSSTAAVYGDPQAPLLGETPSAPCPVNPYGETKLTVEKALASYAGAYGLRYAALRYFNAAGADAAGGNRRVASSRRRTCVPLVLDAALGERPAITVYGDDYATPDGTCIRDYIHVSDLAEAHLAALDHLASGGASGAFNLGTGRGHSVREVIDSVARVTGQVASPSRWAPGGRGIPACSSPRWTGRSPGARVERAPTASSTRSSRTRRAGSTSARARETSHARRCLIDRSSPCGATHGHLRGSTRCWITTFSVCLIFAGTSCSSAPITSCAARRASSASSSSRIPSRRAVRRGLDISRPMADLPELTVVVPRVSAGLTPEEAARQHRELDRSARRRAVDQRPVLWMYTPMALEVVRHLDAALVVYDCMDELSQFDMAPPRIRAFEAELFGRADVVFTGGQSLYEAKRGKHANVHAFPSSVDAAHFARARRAADEPCGPARHPPPADRVLRRHRRAARRRLLAELARMRPDLQLVMIGPVVKVDAATLPRAPNLHWLGCKAHGELPSYIGGWDAAMMPFARNKATEFISPTKTLEFLAAGKPVVSTAIRDVVRPYGDHGLVRIADDARASPGPSTRCSPSPRSGASPRSTRISRAHRGIAPGARCGSSARPR